MKHAELIARLEGGETGRDLDAILWYTLVEKPEPGDKIDKDMIDRWPHFTTSLDAAVALVERVRPGWRWSCGLGPSAAMATIYNPDAGPMSDDRWKAVAPTPAAALLAALLRAEG